MSNLLDIRDGYRQEFRRQEASLPGAGVPWLQQWRAHALEQFMESGFPTFKHEDWKYTDVRAIAQHRFAPLAPAARLERAALAAHALDAHELVFVDGVLAPELSRLEALPSGVQLTSLAEQLARDPAAVEGRYGKLASSEDNGFSALNSAFAAHGAVLHIARGVAVERPIHLLFVSTGASDSLHYLRNLVVAEAGSQATLVESHVGLNGGSYLTNAITEVAVEAGAQLDHYRLGRESEAAWHIGGTYVRQGLDSHYRSHVVVLGARLARHELRCALDAEGAECLLNGLSYTHGRQHVDNHTRIDHRLPHTTSREWYKGVLADQSRSVFSGRVVVHPGAQHADAEQNNRNLLLSRSAEADSRPQLEIYADDVKCAHGSATGSLDPEQLFYLRARGLDAPQARSLLVYAFAADVLARLRLTELRRRLTQELGERLLPGAALEGLLS
jgi:Fe-S cluster assembly protein SufD